MTKRALLLTFFLVIVFVISLNVFLDRWSVRTPARRKLQAIQSARNPNLLFVGNSLLDGHLDIDALREGLGSLGDSTLPLNAALGGSDAPVQRLLTEYALRCHPSVRTLVVGMFDFQLTEEHPHTPMSLTGTWGVGQDSRFSAQDIFSAYGFDRFQRAEFVALRPLKMVTYRENAWKYVELLRRSMGEIGMPRAATNGNGRVADFAALEAGGSSVFDQEASRSLNNGGLLNPSYRSIFDQAAKHNLHVIVVIMPMSPSHWKHYYSRPLWARYVDVERKVLNARGIRVIDASHWFSSQAQFADVLHMAPGVATDFSKRLGAQMAEGGM
jgi:hypothetical protein